MRTAAPPSPRSPGATASPKPTSASSLGLPAVASCLRANADRLNGDVALLANVDDGPEVGDIGLAMRGEPVSRHAYGIEVQALEAAPVHRHRSAVSSHANQSGQSFLPRLQHGVQRGAGREPLEPRLTANRD